MIETDVIVIGGGATGCGVARDLALRGIPHCLIEKGDLGAGATGACHGLLHSGGRYVVGDPQAARECIGENRILRRIASKCVEPSGGLFVRLPGDSPEYRDRFLEACDVVGIETQALSGSQAREAVPALSPQTLEAVRVPDCAIDPFRLCVLNTVSSQNRGQPILIHHRVHDVLKERGRCVGVKARNVYTAEEVEVRGKAIVNAAGAWAHGIAAMAGNGVPITLSKGSLIIASHRLTNMVINRLRPPADGDIIVPNETVCLCGTTSQAIDEPDAARVEAAEVDTLIREAAAMLPQFAETRLIRAYAGVRPLIRADASSDGRSVSRGFRIFDHGDGMLSIVGGKLTTYRLMAEAVTDTLMDSFGLTVPCATADTPLEGQDELPGYPLSGRIEKLEDIVCECEVVRRGDVERAIRGMSTGHLADVQHRTRLGMGPCQGGFCTYRALGIMQELGTVDPQSSVRALKEFLGRRFRGIKPVLWGDQLREEQFVEGIYLGVLDL